MNNHKSVEILYFLKNIVHIYKLCNNKWQRVHTHRTQIDQYLKKERLVNEGQKTNEGNTQAKKIETNLEKQNTARSSFFDDLEKYRSPKSVNRNNTAPMVLKPRLINIF